MTHTGLRNESALGVYQWSWGEAADQDVEGGGIHTVTWAQGIVGGPLWTFRGHTQTIRHADRFGFTPPRDAMDFRAFVETWRATLDAEQLSKINYLLRPPGVDAKPYPGPTKG